MKLWTGVITERVVESRDFYVRLFGCSVLFDSDWFVLLELGGGELGFLKPDLPTQAVPFRGAYPGQGMWVTIDVDDVEAHPCAPGVARRSDRTGPAHRGVGRPAVCDPRPQRDRGRHRHSSGCTSLLTHAGRDAAQRNDRTGCVQALRPLESVTRARTYPSLPLSR